MTDELLVFKKKAEKNGMCDKGISAFDSAKSKKDLFDAASTIQGIEFLCQAKKEGWMLDNHFIKRFFSGFINQPYHNELDDCNSGIYVGSKMAISMLENVSCFIDCDIIIKLPRYVHCYIYVCGKSKVRVEGLGSAVILTYGEDVVVENKSLKSKIKKI